ncbi:hypothetical protein E1286_21085 [Nonomuraea terrae]|uniref:Secreted protein n=1 Tax=Nonomuraea terrae TaxID=2530383 RepID=A0A4R4YQD5_9ACTN|nr:hypothetical protein [Nonomuraea terrae]TDD46359.1 hypothetical protein E1286_21085 [Nonomuraea terrae]
MTAGRIALALLTPLVLLVAASPARAEAPYCGPETPVCGELDGGSYVFTLRPPPATLSVTATVNGAPVTGSLTAFPQPGYVRGWYEPYPPPAPGDVLCLTFHANGTPLGPYCDTA